MGTAGVRGRRDNVVVPLNDQGGLYDRFQINSDAFIGFTVLPSEAICEGA